MARPVDVASLPANLASEAPELVSLAAYPGYRSAAPEVSGTDVATGEGPPGRRRVTEADRRRWQEWQQGRIEAAFAEGQQAEAEGRLTDALNAFERAHRLSPDDPVLIFALGLARSNTGDRAGCLALMERAAKEFDLREAWATAMSCALALGLFHRAGLMAERMLSTHGFDPIIAEALDRVAGVSGRVGWCALSGVDSPSLNIVCAGPVRMIADGRELAPGATKRRAGWRAIPLPPEWEQWSSLVVTDAKKVPLLGSPLRPARIARLAGVVTAAGPRRVEGWAWYPADPARTPELAVREVGGEEAGAEVLRLTLDEAADPLPGHALARPRRIAFALPRRLAGRPVDVTDLNGQSLLGSPLDPVVETRAADFSPHPAGLVRGVPRVRTGARAVDVVVPVYRHCRRTLACLDGVLATVPDGTRVIVVEDASPDADLRAALDGLASTGAITLLRVPRNRGFTHAANKGLALSSARKNAASGRDVVLLNSDTLVGAGWFERLRAVAYSAPDIGSVTPFSNDATILSYPDSRRANPVPDQAQTDRLAALAFAANGHDTVDLPTAIGFCMFIRRDCLDQVGMLREDLFAQGYGEENDWSLRAAALGWRNVAATGVYVAHVGGVSFGSARTALMARNEAILARLHPGYAALVAAHIDADPLADARRRFDLARFEAFSPGSDAQPGGTVALVTHDQGGGVERVVRTRIDAIRAAGQRALVLRPSVEGGACMLADGADETTPNLTWRLPEEFDALCDVLRRAGVTSFEWHHMLGHEPEMRALPAALGVPYAITVHDYASFCPRVVLVSYGRRYCGEPDVAECEACIAGLGRRIDEPIGVADLRRRSAHEFSMAKRVIVPSDDVGRRITRHFPASKISVEPWEDDRLDLDGTAFARLQPPLPAQPPVLPRNGRVRVVLIGGIGPEKGYDILLGCLQAVREEGLPLEFVIAGFTPDDTVLRDAGCGPITGEYKEGELQQLLAGFDADVAFLPSVCPETWSFTLSEAWKAGLPAVVFDLGAPAARVRATGRGLVLPIALPAAMICRQLLGVAQAALSKRDRLAQNADASHFNALSI